MAGKLVLVSVILLCLAGILALYVWFIMQMVDTALEVVMWVYRRGVQAGCCSPP